MKTEQNNTLVERPDSQGRRFTCGTIFVTAIGTIVCLLGTNFAMNITIVIEENWYTHKLN